MKKILLMVAAVLALTLAGCQENKDYKALGEQMAQRLEQLCEQQDSAAVLALDDSIRIQLEEIMASGDTAGYEAFKDALKAAREMSAPYITVLKVNQGESKDSAVKRVMDDVMNGEVSIDALTSSIDAALKVETEGQK
ncbi:MAG: hypothetical protein IJV05_01755 [Muribaculaceae bacterium]|nr:hypothetical protein [Muribaculaceae bacterium]